MRETPPAVRNAAQHWQLIIGEALPGGTSSTVYAARDQQGRDVVIKIPAARIDAAQVLAREAAALRVWASTGASARLIDANAEALLLVRSRRGTLMPNVTDESVDAIAGIAAALLERLWTTENTSPNDFPGQSTVYAEDERIAKEDAAYEQEQSGNPDLGRLGLELLPKARVAAEHLIKTTPQPILLHGDFITKNLISDETSTVGYVSIDPLPYLGDPASEVAAFAVYQPAEMIFTVAAALADHLGLDQRRTLRWTAIRLIHQTAQAWRDDQAPLETLVRSDTIKHLLNGSDHGA